MITLDPRIHSIQTLWPGKETVSLVVMDNKFNNGGVFDPPDWQPMSELDKSWRVFMSMARGGNGPLTLDLILIREIPQA